MKFNLPESRHAACRQGVNRNLKKGIVVSSRLLKNGPHDLPAVPAALFLLPEKTFGFAV